MKITTVMQRNLKLLLRSRTSALVIVLGPLFIIFLVGIAFNTSSLYSINVGVYDPSNTELSLSYIDSIQNNDFDLRLFSSEEDCVQSVKWGETHVCIVFPENFVVENNKTNNIVFYADTSKVNLVYMVIDTISTEVSSTSTELSAGMTEVILGAIDKTKIALDVDAQLMEKQNAELDSALDNSDIASDTLEAIELDSGYSGMKDLEDGRDSLDDLLDDSNDISSDAISELDYLISAVRTKIELIYDDVSTSNLSIDDSQAIIDYINDSYVVVSELELRLEDLKSNASVDFDAFTELINEADNNFRNVVYLMEKADYARDQILSDIENVKNNIQKSKNLTVNISQNHVDLITSFNSIKVTNAESIVSPITTSIKPVTSEQSNLGYLYPGLITLVIMFISLVLSSTLVIMERKSLATFRNFCTPTKLISFMFGTYLTSLFVVLFQIGLILGITSFVFHAAFAANLLALGVITFALSTLFILVGMGIGSLFSSQETVMLASISIGSLFLLISDLILPLESMPREIANLAGLNPFVIGSNLLKQVILFGVPLIEILDQLYMIGLYCVGIFFLTFFIQRLMKARFLKLYSHFHGRKKPKPFMKLDSTEHLILGDTKITTLAELAEAIKALDIKVFKAYNDEHVFSDWIKRAYTDEELAIRFKDKKGLRNKIALLKKAQRTRDRLKRRQG